MAAPDGPVPRLPLAAGWTVVQVTGPPGPGCLGGWCSRVRRLLVRGRVVICDLRQLAAADLAAVDALARLCLAARRAGSDLRILAAGTELERLWEWTGLAALGIGTAGRADDPAGGTPGSAGDEEVLGHDAALGC